MIPINSWEDWINTRPIIIQNLARKYPPDTKLNIDNRIMYVIAYNEDGTLGVTENNPFEDYEKALNTIENLCKDCMNRIEELIIIKFNDPSTRKGHQPTTK